MICSPSWLRPVPSLVAESLSGIRRPLEAWLRAGPPAPPSQVAAALARAMLPPEAPDQPPIWLRPDQRLSFRRAVAAVRRHGGALLADGVGTGKTWIGLAVAATIEPARPIYVIAPAGLRSQWHEAAARIGLTIVSHSHETLSRGRPPPEGAGPVVIDESHRFRTSATRRYATLAPWCVQRRGILLSATPVVNRLSDLSHQLLLLIRDDALAWSGVFSLRRTLETTPPAGLEELVVTGEDRSGRLPRRHQSAIRHSTTPEWRRVLRECLRLRLSTDPATAELLRSVLLHALASSPAATAAALARYGGLLRHARDAAASGFRLTRDAIRRYVGADADQLVLWPLVAEPAQRVELVLDDLERVGRLERLAALACARPDPKALALGGVLADRKPTLVFSTAIATVSHLRRRIGRHGIAWCTGQGAGLDGSELPREAVLDWFRRAELPGDRHFPRPSVLLATDVAAEGLDLPLIERVVHYDLPWTAVRMEQRSGRAIRLGSRHRQVDIVRFDPPRELRALLGQEAILARKAGLPLLVGLDPGPAAAWRLRARVAASWSGEPRREGTAVVRDREPGAVAGIRIRWSDGSVRELVLARTSRGWSADAGTIERLLAAGGDPDRMPEESSAAALRPAVRGLSARLSSLLRVANGVELGTAPGGRCAPVLRRRLVALATGAARERNTRRLELVARGLRHLGHGLTAGEERRLESWMKLEDRSLVDRLARLPLEAPRPAAVDVTLFSLLIVEPE
ncbi:MAG TPA: helicase-related protein [Gemmatimonadales bacterium]|nr:helicase-related protein [Gemmatimonadales bacterium]